MVALWVQPCYLFGFSFLFLVVSFGASLFLSFMVFSPVSLFLVIILRGCLLRSLRYLFLLRYLVSAFAFFPFSGFSFLALTLPSVLFLPLSQGDCRSFCFGLSLFSSKVPLSVGASHSDESMVLPCISPAFCFMGLVLFLRLQLAWFRSLFCRRLFSIFLHSFRLVCFFSFFSALSQVLSHLLPQGPPLGSCVLLFGFWLVCPTLGCSNSVSLCCGPPGCFFRGFPPLPVLLCTFSPVARSPSVVRYCFLLRSLSKRSWRSFLLSSLPVDSSSCFTFWRC